MSDVDTPRFPGGSKSRVKRAGQNIREGIATPEDLAVIDEWRAAHRGVLNTFQAILRGRTRGTGITVAQRHKRKLTIFDKLERLPRMQLSRMDDVAGCRLIFKSIKDLYAFRGQFHRARFKHERRNELDKYDYVKVPRGPDIEVSMTCMSTTSTRRLERSSQGYTSRFSIELSFNMRGPSS